MYNFIVNPVAGRGKTKKAMQRISELLNNKKIMHRVYYSLYKGHMGEIARELEAAKEDNIIIVGGDGSINEVLNGLKKPKNIKIGIIPSGTGNDFAKLAGLNKNPIKAMEDILEENIREIDYLETPDKRAINTISTGLDIDIISRYNRFKKHTRILYYWSLLITLLRFNFHKFQFVIDGKEHEESEYFLAVASNGQFFGGGMKVSPHSHISDGKINFIAINQLKGRQIFAAALNLVKGAHINKKYTIEALCDAVQVNTLSEDNKLTVNYDGELLENSTFDVHIKENGLRVYLPKGSEKL